MKSLISTILIIASIVSAKAQQQSDSMEVNGVLEEVFTVCNSASPEGENSKIVIFERLSRYIIYNGSEPDRKNKTACDYNKAEDRKIVDDAGIKIKTWLDNIETYKLIKYSLKKEGSVDKHILLFAFKSGAAKKEISFTFIKIKDIFLLSEIN